MINELYQLSVSMKQAGIIAQNWHRKYKLIPNVTDKSPCCKLTLNDGKVISIENVSKEQAASLRKYGTNQGTFPCMNLVPLFRITDDNIKKQLSSLQAEPEQINEQMLQQLTAWCCVNNWTPKFRKKYNISMRTVPEELSILLNKESYSPLSVLLQDASPFIDPDILFDEMQRVALEMIEQKNNVQLALQILFHQGSSEKEPENDTGTLSVALESNRLIAMGKPVVSNLFVNEFNEFLLSTDETNDEQEQKETGRDAFGNSYTPIEEPMPSVKLAGGFDVTLRTMFKEQHCQQRYGAIENASYPIIPAMRRDLQSALSWLGGSDHKGVYWLNTDKQEILFAYPHTLPRTPISFMKPFGENRQIMFQTAAKAFLDSVMTLRENTEDSLSERIQLFILRKITKGQTKVVYTRVTSPNELNARSQEWIAGCRNNVPRLCLKQYYIPYPIEVADAMNRTWKQDGTIATDKFRPIPKYRGMQLFMDHDSPTLQYLHMLVQSCNNFAPFLGSNRSTISKAQAVLQEKRSKEMEDLLYVSRKVLPQIALLGFLLYRMDIRKEQYMNSLPFQYGQLLNAADELHILYCQVVRKGDIPPQLVGASMYLAATESPVRTLNMLQQRMNPYIVWAKTYRRKNEQDSWKAGWLYSVIEKTANQLATVWTPDFRMGDPEKAQMFLGYLSSLPRSSKEKDEDTSETIMEEMKNE